MHTLPRTNEAVVPVEKFTKYALNPDGDRNKAVAFEFDDNANGGMRLITAHIDD